MCSFGLQVGWSIRSCEDMHDSEICQENQAFKLKNSQIIMCGPNANM